MVANAGLVAIVFACDRPPPNPRLIDRFLVVTEYNEVPALIVANKVDLIGADAARELFGPYERIGYDVVVTAAKGGEDGGYVVRAYETTGRPAHARLDVLGTTVDVDFGAHEIKTFLLREGAATETDLLEL